MSLASSTDDLCMGGKDNYDSELYSYEFYNHPDGGQRIRGIIANDKKNRWSDGHRVFTSVVVNVDRSSGTAQTLNTIYKLCGPWTGKWSMRTLEDKIVEVDGPVHFDIVRW